MTKGAVALRCAIGALSLGACCGLASEPLGWHLVQWVALVPLLRAWDGLSRRASLLAGLAAGVGVNTALFTWLGPSVARYADLPAPLTWVLFLVFALWEALPFAALGLIDWAARRRAPALRWLLFSCGLVLVEWIWPRLFAWTAGTPQVSALWVSQSADVVGPYGLSALIALSNGALDALWTRRAKGPALGVGALLAVVLVYGVIRAQTVDAGPSVRVGWVQPGRVFTDDHGDTPQAVWAALRAGADELRRAPQRPDLVVFPEGAVPDTWIEVERPAGGTPAQLSLAARAEQERRGLERALADLSRRARAPVLVGIIRWRARAKADGQELEAIERWNAALLADEAGVRDGEAKRNLLPFGEYLPGEQTWPTLRELLPQAGALVPGRGDGRLRAGALELGLLVCYEAVPPRPFGQSSPQVLVNPTNDVWFGRGQGPALHAMISRLRALEARRPLVRVTTTGLTRLVAPSGRLLASGGLGRDLQSGVCELPLGAQAQPGPTLYLRFGDWVVALAAAGVLWLLLEGYSRQRAPTAG
ncbi:MAG: apolipoprotein N-acyltransferase [Planctomycetota bacterium]